MLLSWFRVWMLWGLEITKTLFYARQSRARIQYRSHAETVFPVSRWVLNNDMLYCLAAESGIKDIVIMNTGVLHDN